MKHLPHGLAELGDRTLDLIRAAHYRDVEANDLPVLAHRHRVRPGQVGRRMVAEISNLTPTFFIVSRK